MNDFLKVGLILVGVLLGELLVVGIVLFLERKYGTNNSDNAIFEITPEPFVGYKEVAYKEEIDESGKPKITKLKLKE